MSACVIRHFMDLSRLLKPSLKGSILSCSILAFFAQAQMRICLSTSMVFFWVYSYFMWMTLSLLGTILPSLRLLFSGLVLILILEILVLFTTFLLQIDYTNTGLFVHQTKYATNLLAEFAMIDFKPCKTPCSPNQHLLPNDSPFLPNPTSYQSLVDALQYPTFTRPDLSFAIQQACQYMGNPTQNHFQASKRILRYIRGTLHYGVAFTPGYPSLSTYSDAHWAGDSIDHKFITSIVVFFGNCLITWSAKKQTTVSRSLAVELCWICMLLHDLGIFLNNHSLLWCDNVSALVIALNPIFHAHTKHIEVDYQFVLERVLNVIFKLSLFLSMIRLPIYLQKVFLLLVSIGLPPNSYGHSPFV